MGCTEKLDNGERCGQPGRGWAFWATAGIICRRIGSINAVAVERRLPLVLLRPGKGV